MRKVQQTRMSGDPGNPGNCFAACLASVLDVPLDEVPDELAVIQQTPRRGPESDSNYYARCWGEYWITLSNWLAAHYGLGMMMLDNKAISDSGFIHDDSALLLASGDGPRGVRHCVVCRGTEIVHDPHPSGEGIDLQGHVHWVMLVPLDPSGLVCLSKARRVLDRFGRLL